MLLILALLLLSPGAFAQEPRPFTICKLATDPPRFGVWVHSALEGKGHCQAIPGGHLYTDDDVGKTAAEIGPKAPIIQNGVRQ